MGDHTSENDNKLPEATIMRLADLRRSLLHLHKILLDMERANFERLFGRVTSGELLQLVINHAQFAWLRTGECQLKHEKDPGLFEDPGSFSICQLLRA